MPYQLGTKCLVKTSTIKTSTGNSMARLAFWFFGQMLRLWLGVMSVKTLFCLVSFQFQLSWTNMQIIDHHSSLFPPGRAGGDLPLLNMLSRAANCSDFPFLAE